MKSMLTLPPSSMGEPDNWTFHRAHLVEALAYFMQMLVREQLVCTHVVVAPGEMGGGTRFLTCTSTSRYSVHRNVIIYKPHLCSRQKPELYTCGETAGVGNVYCISDLLFVYLWESVYIIVFAFDAEILCEVDYLHVGRNVVFLQELLALAVPEAEEHHINIIERHLRSELQVGVANQSFVHISNGIARITLRVGKHNLRLWVVQQQSYEFATSIACGT